MELAQRHFGENDNEWPHAIKSIFLEKKDDLAMTALGLAIVYLEKLLLAETSIPVADFYT
jgi:hypothetical protein